MLMQQSEVYLQKTYPGEAFCKLHRKQDQFLLMLLHFRLANQFMDGLRITEHANKYAKDCSGGTKRKLSYAMSMLGNPKIVLLDEPSTGMDPQSKRFVWDTVLASFRKERGAILTTHSMEEADALCNRVGIMVKGELRCLGSTQHLKNKYGGGYMLEVKLKHRHVNNSADGWESVEAEVMEFFTDAVLSESFADRRTYAIPQSSVSSLSTTFETLESCKYHTRMNAMNSVINAFGIISVKSRFDIEEYSFGQTTLEQVFIEFAKQQEAANIDEHDGGESEEKAVMREIVNSTGMRMLHSVVDGGKITSI
jgi:ATP-binding cassette subfamily A (ABC1) protein 5